MDSIPFERYIQRNAIIKSIDPPENDESIKSLTIKKSQNSVPGTLQTKSEHRSKYQKSKAVLVSFQNIMKNSSTQFMKQRF